MRKRGLYCRPVSACPSVRYVRPSVCLSVRHVGVLYPDGYRYCQVLFRLGRPIILVFNPKRQYPVPRESFRGAINTRGVGKYCDFD